MTAKSLLIVGALALGSIGIASAKSYDFSLSSPAVAGPQNLKPGEYKVKVEGSQAIFTNVEGGKSFTVPVTVEHSGQRFDRTSVETVAGNGADKIKTIHLGGSDTVIRLDN